MSDEAIASAVSDPGPPASVPGHRMRAAMVGVAVFLVAGLIAGLLPQAPNYDTALNLVWARETWDGMPPAFDAPAASTMHPLWLLISMLAIPFGAGTAMEAMQMITVASLGFVVAGAWTLARGIAGPVAGAIAALGTASSFALLLLAYKSYVDVPFVALVLWGVVLESRARGEATSAQAVNVAISTSGHVDRDVHRAGWWLVPVLLLLAGLLRPEAWAFGLLLVGSRLLRGARLPELIGPALIVLAAPVIWMLTDFALTGEPLHSLTGTRELAEELGRPTGLARAPRELVVLLADLARPPIAAAGLVGVLLAAWGGRWRSPPAGLPLLVFAAACGGFVLVGLLGLPLLQRYLLIAGILVAVFAGVTVAVLWALARDAEDPRLAAPPSGGAAPEPGHAITGERADSPQESAARSGTAAGDRKSPVGARPSWLQPAAIGLLALGVLGSAGYLVLKAGSFATVARGALREATWQRQAAELLEDPALAGEVCGAITLPTYRLVPELALRSGRAMSSGDADADRPLGAIASRATSLGGIGQQSTGVTIVIDGNRKAMTRLAYAAGVDRSSNDVPPASAWEQVARRGPFVAYVSCI